MLKMVKGFALIGTVALLSACGQSNMSDAFKNITIKNLDSNGDAIVELKTEVGAQNIIFSTMTLPIVDSKTGKNYGTVSMERTMEGKNILTVSANVTGIKLGNVLADNKLPNGTAVPVVGLTSLVAVQAGSNSRVYVGVNGDKLVLGTAVAVQQFDNLASYIPGASVFFNFAADAGATGLGGFFTSAESGKSGIAMFVQTDVPSTLLPGVSSKMASASTSAVKFVEKKPTAEQSTYFGYFLNRWNKAKTVLKVK